MDDTVWYSKQDRGRGVWPLVCFLSGLLGTPSLLLGGILLVNFVGSPLPEAERNILLVSIFCLPVISSLIFGVLAYQQIRRHQCSAWQKFATATGLLGPIAWIVLAIVL